MWVLDLPPQAQADWWAADIAIAPLVLGAILLRPIRSA